MALTGLRPGELLGLTIRNVQDEMLQIEQAINTYNETTDGKNDNAKRAFIMNDYAREVYECQRELLRQAGLDRSLDNPLFPFRSESNLYHYWVHYQESNGMPPISAYELRHTFVSLA